MEMVIVVIAVAVLGLASMVAAGKLGEMDAEPVRDRYQPPLPASGPLRGDDLAGVTFATSARGYDMAEVDDLMARMARELDGRDRRSAEQAAGRTPASDVGAEAAAEGEPSLPNGVGERREAGVEPAGARQESVKESVREKADRWRGKEGKGPAETEAGGAVSPWAARRSSHDSESES